jgi:hypothetical protein
MDARVECHAGRKADERLVRFCLAEHEYFVQEILDHWYGPDANFFKVRVDDGNIYILRHDMTLDRWRLESFRRA